MLERIFYFIMVPMVYLAFAIFIFGSISAILKIVFTKKHKGTLEIFTGKKASMISVFSDTFFMPTIKKDNFVFWFFLIIYHIAFISLIISHLDIHPAINIMNSETNHMIGYGIVGLVLTISTIYFIFRRLKAPVRNISNFGDFLVLLLLLFLFLSGDIISWANSWGENGFVLEKSSFAEYFAILTSFSFEDPREVLDGSHYIVVVVHVFLANLFLILFPFTKFIHTFFSIALNKIKRGL